MFSALYHTLRIVLTYSALTPFTSFADVITVVDKILIKEETEYWNDVENSVKRGPENNVFQRRQDKGPSC